MIISDNSNIYEFNALGILALYGELIDATPNCTLGIVSSAPVSEDARNALSASAAQLGFGRDACAWITTQGKDGALQLGADDLYSIIEGLDPVALVAADSQAASLLGKSYSAELKLDGKNRIMCRTAVAFADFEAMLESEDAKQIAWHLLKELK